MPLRRGVVGVAMKLQFRNGRESDDLLPLWWKRMGNARRRSG